MQYFKINKIQHELYDTRVYYGIQVSLSESVILDATIHNIHIYIPNPNRYWHFNERYIKAKTVVTNIYIFKLQRARLFSNCKTVLVVSRSLYQTLVTLHT